jgi:hypothetical protein
MAITHLHKVGILSQSCYLTTTVWPNSVPHVPLGSGPHFTQEYTGLPLDYVSTTSAPEWAVEKSANTSTFPLWGLILRKPLPDSQQLDC